MPTPYDEEPPAPTELESQILEEDMCIISQFPPQVFDDHPPQEFNGIEAENNVFSEDSDSDSEDDSCFVSAIESEAGENNQEIPSELPNQSPNFLRNKNAEFHDVFEHENKLTCIKLLSFKSQCSVTNDETKCSANFSKTPDQSDLIQIFEKHAAKISKPEVFASSGSEEWLNVDPLRIDCCQVGQESKLDGRPAGLSLSQKQSAEPWIDEASRIAQVCDAEVNTPLSAAAEIDGSEHLALDSMAALLAAEQWPCSAGAMAHGKQPVPGSDALSWMALAESPHLVGDACTPPEGADKNRSCGAIGEAILQQEPDVSPEAEAVDLVNKNPTIVIGADASEPENGKTNAFQFSAMEKSLRQLQWEDPELLPLLNFMVHGTLPDDSKICRKVLNQADIHYFDDGVLCKGKYPVRKKSQNSESPYDDEKIIVLPKSVQQEVLNSFHIINHCGVTRLAQNVLRSFTFEGAYRKIAQFVKQCQICSKAKLHLQPKSNLGETLVAKYPNDVWQIDILGGLNLTPDKNLYVISIIDVFSGYLWLHCVPNATSAKIAEKLFLSFTQAGICENLVSDLGANLLSQVMKEVYALFGVKKLNTVAYSPRSLGCLERQHRTVTTALRCLLNEYKDKPWDELIPYIELGMRSAVSPHTNLSPFDIWLGRSVKTTPIEAALNPTGDLGANTQESYVQQVRERLKIMNRIKFETQAELRKNMIENYDATRARPQNFQKGDLVYLKAVLDPTQTRKLSNVWEGPYMIEEVLSGHTVRLRDVKTQELNPSIIHVDRIKLCNTPIEAFLDQTAEVCDQESILRQKGQGQGKKYLVQFCPRKDGLRNEPKWFKGSEVNPGLIDDFYKTHRKDGSIRKRQIKIPPELTVQGSDNDSEPDSDESDDSDPTDMQDKDGGKSEPAMPVPSASDLGLRRSCRSRNVPIKYRTEVD